MKRLRFLPILAVASVALAAQTLSTDALIKDADKHDGKKVTVKGEVLDFEQKTSRAGNPYFVFKLKTKVKETPVNVYGRGTLEPAIKDKDTVEITGTFRKEKKVSTFTVKNEVDVTPEKKGDKPLVKVLGKK